WQFGKRGLLQLLFALRSGRQSQHSSARGNVVRDAGHGANHGAVADGHVISNSDLSSEHDVVAGAGAARDADLRTDQVVPTDAAVVPNLHLVVNFCAFANNRSAVA